MSGKAGISNDVDGEFPLLSTYQYIQDMKLSSKKLAKIKSYFKNKPVERAYLFGSQAREDANSESDIDILVELDYSQKIGLGFVKMQQDLELLLQSKVDLVSSQGLSKYLKPIIDQEKLLIYER